MPLTRRIHEIGVDKVADHRECAGRPRDQPFIEFINIEFVERRFVKRLEAVPETVIETSSLP